MPTDYTPQRPHQGSTPEHIRLSMSVVDQSLREMFPDNYWKRCMYAAFGLQLLLKEEGIASDIVAGDVACFVLYTQDNQPGMDGFKTEKPGVPAHFWVETNDVLIDLGPYYLPRDTRRPIASMPLICWPREVQLPNYLRYREKARYSPGTKLQVADDMMERMASFLAHCESRDRTPPSKVESESWELKGPDSLQAAARKGDRWACGAKKFDSWVNPSKLPF